MAACAVLVQPSGANQSSHYALVRALDAGTAKIDRWHSETRDKAYFEGHYYSVRAPGLAAFALPWYMATDAVGLVGRAESAGERVVDEQGITPLKDTERDRLLLRQAPVIWLLDAWAILPFVARAAAARPVGRRAVRAGLGHRCGGGARARDARAAVLDDALRARARRDAALRGVRAAAARARRAAAPGARRAAPAWLGGLAALIEYPAGLIAAILGVYAATRAGGDLVRRALAFGGGLVAGLLPLALYNLWAFGSLTHMSYDDVVAVEGASGHDVVGLNDEGFFGIGVPDPGAAWDLLFDPRGLLVLTPVVAAAVWGLFRLPRTEGRLIGAIVAVTFLYNAGYYLPFGGSVPGPRFLVLMLPFAAVGLAVALRERTGPALALTAASAVGMVAATMTDPQLPEDADPGDWVDLLGDADLAFTLAGALGTGNGWLGILPFLVLIGLAVALTPLPRPRSIAPVAALLVLGAWTVVALVAGTAPLLTLAGAAAGVLAAARRAARRATAPRTTPRGAGARAAWAATSSTCRAAPSPRARARGGRSSRRRRSRPRCRGRSAGSTAGR